MKNLFSLFIELILLLICAVIWYPTYGQWQKHFIDDNLDYAAGLYVADMDDDNDLDVVASGYNANIVLWYQAPLWIRRVIDESLSFPCDLSVGDMDGNGILDVVATQYSGGNILCYEAPLWSNRRFNIYTLRHNWLA